MIHLQKLLRPEEPQSSNTIQVGFNDYHPKGEVEYMRPFGRIGDTCHRVLMIVRWLESAAT